ncbi:MAG TPA: SGNH/GDSL hydrolase family protein [Vicinamibacterales bacterium]|nr:SGNH/GDSL hydrolase family protein [Vicinamibacterales bacterium]
MKAHTPASISSILLAAFAAAALSVLPGCGDKTDSPTSPSPPPSSGSAVSYTAVGASDAAGVGSSVPCAPFTDCPDGMGYVPRIVRELKAQGSTVTLMNLGIPAAVLSPRIEALGKQYGRTWIPGNFLEQEMPFVARSSTLITIFAGGNDVNTIADAASGGAGGSDPVGWANQQIKAFGEDYATLLKGVRERAPSARIVVANLPNFAAMPFAAGHSVEARQLLQKLSVGFTTQVINPLAGQGIAVIDVQCDGRYTNPGYLASDGFHPNDAGYAAMAADFLRAITATTPAMPSPSCGLMTVVPAL